ncbi:uncharacterized protein BYT42DRAFT_274035 [Radiomyces spectabilis]|uniref:uncharacterized protein n=1 Tax=Radiomyces spectabilis TaxID=64574 RepID=UPI00221ED11D|nr:uncharacterized protein BYT42DRAFT_274035 [Radiomyces spectabilis]KAI8384774.1 hypothetical protein BYT42DRAFT_274035 [Radiomyces spectabilis]
MVVSLLTMIWPISNRPQLPFISFYMPAIIISTNTPSLMSLFLFYQLSIKECAFLRILFFYSLPLMPFTSQSIN